MMDVPPFPESRDVFMDLFSGLSNRPGCRPRMHWIHVGEFVLHLQG